MTQITYERLFEFDRVASLYFRKSKDNEGTKLGYAIKKIGNSEDVKVAAKKYDAARGKIVEDFQERLEDNNIDNCEVDDKKRVIYETTTDDKGKTERHYVFNKDGLRKKNETDRNLKKEYRDKLESFADEWGKKPINIEPYIATLVPNGLTEEELLAFSGIVLPNMPKDCSNESCDEAPRAKILSIGK